MSRFIKNQIIYIIYINLKRINENEIIKCQCITKKEATDVMETNEKA